MRRTRILLALEGLQRDILEGLVADQSDMEIVAAIDRSEDLLSVVERTRAEVIVMGIGRNRLPSDCDELLYAHSRLRVLAIEAGAESGFLYQLAPTKIALGELGPKRLIEAIRTPVLAQPGR